MGTAMLRSLTFLALLFAVPCIQAACYTLYDKDGKTVYQDQAPPYDISLPTASPAQEIARERGMRLLINNSNVCVSWAVSVAEWMALQAEIDANQRRQVAYDSMASQHKLWDAASGAAFPMNPDQYSQQRAAEATLRAMRDANDKLGAINRQLREDRIERRLIANQDHFHQRRIDWRLGDIERSLWR
jgi:hypothetical protein